MNEQKHTIGRHVLELTVSDRDQALSIQNDAANLVKNNLLPELDKLFSRLTTQDETLRLDKLVLDIGDVSKTGFNEQMVSKTIKELENKLTEIIYTKRNQKRGSSPTIDKPEISASFVSKPENKLEQLIHYLKFGTLPWWHKENKKLSLDGLIMDVILEKSEKSSSSILPLINYEQVRRRIAFQLDVKQFFNFFDLLPIQTKQVAIKLFKSLSPEKLVAGPMVEAQFRYHLLKVISEKKQQAATENDILVFVRRLIPEILKNKTSTQQGKLIAVFMTHFLGLPLGQKVKVNIIKYFIQEAKDRKLDFKVIRVPGIDKFIEANDLIFIKKSFDEIKVLKENEDLNISKSEEDAIEKDENLNISKSGEDAIEKDEEIVKPKSGMKYSKKDEEEDTIESIKKEEEIDSKNEISVSKSELAGDSIKKAEITESEAFTSQSKQDKKPDNLSNRNTFRFDSDQMEIYVNNAGLVLLHPFLFYFFNGLGLLDKDKHFISDQATYRAVHLLQYLVTGETASPEHELSLNKILCGIDLNDPIPFDISLTKKEIEECKVLQSVVLERWDALKTSNIEALTEGFLKREGRLTNKGGGWNLFVERKTLDVMLNKLPWSLSMIKLPWRDDLIYIEW